MAVRNKGHAVRVSTPETVIVAGSFAPNGSSAVSASSRKGRGWSVARTSAGLFTVTFGEKYNNLISAVATLQLVTASLDSWFAQVGAYVAASKTLQIRVVDEAAAAVDVAADADNRINFICVFSNTSLIPVRG